MKVVKMTVRVPDYGFEKMDIAGVVVGEVLKEVDLGIDGMVVVKVRVFSAKGDGVENLKGITVTLAVKKKEMVVLTDAQAMGEML